MADRNPPPIAPLICTAALIGAVTLLWWLL
jgi:hypothetical protein